MPSLGEHVSVQGDHDQCDKGQRHTLQPAVFLRPGPRTNIVNLIADLEHEKRLSYQAKSNPHARAVYQNTYSLDGGLRRVFLSYTGVADPKLWNGRLVSTGTRNFFYSTRCVPV